MPTDLQAVLDLLPAPVSEIEQLGGMGRPWSRAPEFMDLFRRLGTTHERRRSSLEHRQMFVVETELEGPPSSARGGRRATLRSAAGPRTMVMLRSPSVGRVMA